MKRVLVTCGTGEIGRRIATLLATHGHEVIVTGRNPDTLTSFVSMLPDLGSRKHSCACVDFSSEDKVKSGIVELSALGPVDDLVLMVPRIPPTKEVLPAASSWFALWQTVFVGPLELVRSFLAASPEPAGRRKVVIISGISSVQVIEHYAANNALRAAWVAQAKTLAFAYGPQRVHFNTLSLGGVMTDKYSARLAEMAKQAGRSFEEQLASEVANVPLRKYASLDEVANAVRLLLSDFTDHMTGQNFAFEGGFFKSYAS
mgnify:CR=1 FL=1